MDLKFASDYWRDRDKKSAFMDFIKTIHGLDFTRWDRRGFWDDAYQPFSFFEGERIVSSVCLYSLSMIVDGAQVKVAQISGVGTLPDYRRRGLNRQLTDAAMELARADHQFFFLFSDQDAVGFYAKCGFKPFTERAPIISAPRLARAAASEVRELDPDSKEDLLLLFTLATRRAPVSTRLGVRNSRLLMFHALYGGLTMAYIKPLSTVVLFSRIAGRLTIYDVVGEQIPDFAALFPYLADGTERDVLFHFMTDKMAIAPEAYQTLPENLTHLHGAFPLQGNVVFPYSCHA